MLPYRYAIFATLLILTVSCKKPEPGQQVPPIEEPKQNIEVQASQVVLSNEEMEIKEYKECENSFQTKSYQPTLEHLENLQDSMRCVENFLSRHSTTAYRNQVYLLRAKIIQDIMKGLEQQKDAGIKGGGGEDLAALQNNRLDSERLKKIRSENYSYIKRAIEETTISIYYDIFLELKEKGLKMGDPRSKIEQGNRMAKQTGVWESSIDEERDDGKFIVKRWMTEKEPMFVIEGSGSVSPIIQVEDQSLESEGYLSKHCLVNLGIGSERHPFACLDYLKGILSASVKNKVLANIKHDMTQQ